MLSPSEIHQISFAALQRALNPFQILRKSRMFPINEQKNIFN